LIDVVAAMSRIQPSHIVTSRPLFEGRNSIRVRCPATDPQMVHDTSGPEKVRGYESD
jgi:hypothetical protein